MPILFLNKSTASPADLTDAPAHPAAAHVGSGQGAGAAGHQAPAHGDGQDGPHPGRLPVCQDEDQALQPHPRLFHYLQSVWTVCELHGSR